jgi:hypothetical protein
MGDRYTAINTETTTLEFQFLRNGANFDAYVVSKVTIHATYDDALDDANIIETIGAGTITRIALGKYQYTAAIIATGGIYYDKIFLTPVVGAIERSYINSFNVEDELSGTDAQITTSDLQQIKKVIAYPIADDLLLTDEQIKSLILKPELDRYFRKFPIKTINEYQVSLNSETPIPFPNIGTYGVVNARLVGKDKMTATGTSFWDLVAYNALGLNTRHSGMYGVRGFNPNALRQMTIQKRAEIATLTNMGTIALRVDQANRILYAYSSIPGRVNVVWASASNDFSKVSFEYKWDVIQLCQAGILDHLADASSMLENASEVNINADALRARANELRTAILDEWKAIPDVVVIRMN